MQTGVFVTRSWHAIASLLRPVLRDPRREETVTILLQCFHLMFSHVSWLSAAFLGPGSTPGSKKERAARSRWPRFEEGEFPIMHDRSWYAAGYWANYQLTANLNAQNTWLMVVRRLKVIPANPQNKIRFSASRWCILLQFCSLVPNMKSEIDLEQCTLFCSVFFPDTRNSVRWVLNNICCTWN